MATATVEFTLPGYTGMTLAATLYSYQTDTLVHTLSSVTEATNRLGTYSGTQASPTPGLYQVRILESTTTRGEGWVYVTDTATVHTVQDTPAAALMGSPAGVSIAADIATAQADLDVITGASGVNLLTATQASIDAIETAWTTVLTEAYAAAGAEGTPAQILYLIQQRLTEFGISTDTLTVNKLDGITAAATITHDDQTNPTSATRAT